jgi:hypothetical protein
VADSVESLFDVQKGRRTVLFKLEGGGNQINNSMALLDGGVVRSESELVFRNYILGFKDGTWMSLSKIFSITGRRPMGR